MEIAYHPLSKEYNFLFLINMWQLPSFLVSPTGSNMGQPRDKYSSHSCLLPLRFHTSPDMLQMIDYQPNIWNRCSQVRRRVDALCHPKGIQNHLKSLSILRNPILFYPNSNSRYKKEWQHFNILTLPLFFIQWPHASIICSPITPKHCSPSSQTPQDSLLLEPHGSPSCFKFPGSVFLTKRLDV